LNETIGSLIKYMFYANDTSNNWNVTPVYSFETTSSADNPPTWSDNSTNSTEVGDPIEFRIKLSDDNGLSYYNFSLDNCTGTLVNISDGSLSGTEDWANVSHLINITTNCQVRYQWYFNDSADNWNSSDVFKFNTSCYCGDYCILELPYTAKYDGKTYCMKEDLSEGGVTGVTFSGSAVHNSTLDCQGNTIDGDETEDTNGVYLSSGSKNNTIKNCRIVNFWNGIYLDGATNNTILNNTIYNNSYTYISDGIFLSSSSHYNNITDNIIETNYRGINIHSNYNILTGNTINDSRLYGIAIIYGDRNEFYNNSIIETTAFFEYSSGIFLDFYASYNIFEDNNITDNSKAGILFHQTKGSYNEFINNIIKDNYYGVLDQSPASAVGHSNNFTDGMIYSNTYDYYLKYYTTDWYFRNTDFNNPRKFVLFTNKVFNYYNDSTELLLTTSLDASRTITRVISKWTQILMKWDDTGTVTAYYNISGLNANTDYGVYNNSNLVYTLITDNTGILPQFSIGLNGESEIKIERVPKPPKKFRCEKELCYKNHFHNFDFIAKLGSCELLEYYPYFLIFDDTKDILWDIICLS